MPSEMLAGDRPELSIVIVSWNVAELLADCLQSIQEHAGTLSYEVIVIDNHSADRTVDVVRERFPWVHLIVNEKNLGFAKANNEAIPHIRARQVLFLNPDTVVTEGALERIVRFLLEHPEAGVVGPRVCSPDGQVQAGCARPSFSLSAALWCEALRLNEMPIVRGWIIRKYVSPYDYDVTQEVAAIAGAAMLMPFEILRSLGGMGESYIHCGEDLDLCFRVRKDGWKIYYVADATILHVGGASTRQAPVRSAVNVMLSNYQFFYQCHGKLQAALYRFISQGVGIPVMLLIATGKALAGSESASDLRRRVTIAAKTLAWREMK